VCFSDEEPGADHTEKLVEREKKWQKMMSVNKKDLTVEALQKNQEFRRRVFKGIPYSWRIQVWKILTVGELDQRRIDIYSVSFPPSPVGPNRSPFTFLSFSPNTANA